MATSGARNHAAFSLFILAILLGLIVCLAALSFGWSLVETVRLTTLAVGREPMIMGFPLWGIALGIVIQFTPTVLLISVGKVKGTVPLIALVAGVSIMSLIDIYTNWNAMTIRYSTGLFPAQAQYLGYALSVMIVGAEELLAFLLALAANEFAVFQRGRGQRPPEWLFIAEEVGYRASGATLLGRQTPAQARASR